MRKPKFQKKFLFNKITIASLDHQAMNQIMGGVISKWTCITDCEYCTRVETCPPPTVSCNSVGCD